MRLFTTWTLVLLLSLSLTLGCKKKTSSSTSSDSSDQVADNGSTPDAGMTGGGASPDMTGGAGPGIADGQPLQTEHVFRALCALLLRDHAPRREGHTAQDHIL